MVKVSYLCSCNIFMFNLYIYVQVYVKFMIKSYIRRLILVLKSLSCVKFSNSMFEGSKFMFQNYIEPRCDPYFEDELILCLIFCMLT